MNSSGPAAQRIKDAGVWFVQITIAKYLFNQNKRRSATFWLSGFWALSVALAAKCAKICIKMPEQSVPHPLPLVQQ